MWDYEIHEECGYENARCACPKNVDNPTYDHELIAQLVKDIKEALK